MADQLKRSSRSAGEYANEANANMGLASQIGGGSGAAPGSYSSAIDLAYSKQAQDQVQELKDQNAFNSKLKKATDLQKSFSNYQQVKMNRLESLRAATEAYAANEQARAQLISGLFNIGSSMAGSYAGQKSGQKASASQGDSYASAGLDVPRVGVTNKQFQQMEY